MRTVVWLSSILTIGGLFFACSDEAEQQRATGAGGTKGGAAGASGRSTGGAGVTGNAGSAGQSSLKLGDAIAFVASTGDVPYALGDNAYGMSGGAFLARSAQGNTVAIGTEPGKICIRGNLEEVPNGNYSQYWGVEVGFNLNQGSPVALDSGGSAGSWGGATGGAGTAGETGSLNAAGGSAGTAGHADNGGATNAAGSAAVAEVARPWLQGDVIGFSFVIEGPTINLIRFKVLPTGFDATLESSVYCKPIAAVSGERVQVLFSELKQYCWNATASVVIPSSAGFANLSWQLPADVSVGVRPFDWCLTELRPILAE